MGLEIATFSLEVLVVTGADPSVVPSLDVAAIEFEVREPTTTDQGEAEEEVFGTAVEEAFTAVEGANAVDDAFAFSIDFVALTVADTTGLPPLFWC